MMNQNKGFTGSTIDLDLAQVGDIVVFAGIDDPTDDHAALFIRTRWASAVTYPAGLPDSVEAFEGLTFVEVEILDSTGGSLHSDDSRLVEYPAWVFIQTQGVGTGVIGVLVDEDGIIHGHAWSLPSNGDPLSGDDDERNDWVRNLNGRLELQTGNGGREPRIGRPALWFLAERSLTKRTLGPWIQGAFLPIARHPGADSLRPSAQDPATRNLPHQTT